MKLTGIEIHHPSSIKKKEVIFGRTERNWRIFGMFCMVILKALMMKCLIFFNGSFDTINMIILQTFKKEEFAENGVFRE